MSDYNIASLLKELRIARNFSIQDIANYLNVSKVAVSKWENGCDIKVDNLYDLSKLYNVTVDELYDGKLKEECDEIYWKRNYDLSKYYFDNVNEKNIDQIKELYQRCKSVKERFYKLLPKWANDELENKTIEEFNYIKKYFRFDFNYYKYVSNINAYSFSLNNHEKEFIKNRINDISKLSKDYYNWEISKLYDYDIDKKNEIIFNSQNEKALAYTLDVSLQIEKDYLLYINVYQKDEFENYKKIDDNKIENNIFIKKLLESGAKMMHVYKTIDNFWDEELFNKIEGKSKELVQSVYKKYVFDNYIGQSEIPIFNNWKAYTFENYKDFVDEEETNRIKDIIYLKNQKPLDYYNNLLRRDGIINE